MLQRLQINDVRNLIKNAVQPELAPMINEGGIETAAAIARKKALLHWFKSSDPPSLDQDSHPALIEAIVRPLNGVMALKKPCPASISIMKFVKDVLSHCDAQNSRHKPPFINNGQGQLIHVSRAIIHEVTNFATCQGDCIGKDLKCIIFNGFVTACYMLKINQVPWSTPPPPSHRGAPSTCVTHDIWMSLSANSQSNAPTSVAICAHNNIPTAITHHHTSQLIVTNDNCGDWFAIEVYIVQAYNFAITAYNASKPLHHLAIITAITCSGLLPKVFDFSHIFMRMVTLYIICMYEKDSPIVMRQNSKEKGTSNKKWVTKNSTKGITSFLLCQLGMANIKTQRAFNSA
ncbi:hypothetical protein JVT61DRAFT_7443 [Boletus reticuloceps]|uniref:Uncharacterized protein n=1 Tax=Boletus reticuloceps TaxID=495285 RepID=A0A8I2YJB1_9AGAM|nr:hypothetical protein JVT61DRAFT_7443 [Boletus reticuloceps]